MPKKKLNKNGIRVLPPPTTSPLDRDCHLCGLATLKKSHVGGNHPLVRTRDHIVPTSRGGPADFKNTLPAHRYCNGRRRNMLLEELPANFRTALRYTVQIMAARDTAIPAGRPAPLGILEFGRHHDDPDRRLGSHQTLRP